MHRACSLVRSKRNSRLIRAAGKSCQWMLACLMQPKVTRSVYFIPGRDRYSCRGAGQGTLQIKCSGKVTSNFNVTGQGKADHKWQWLLSWRLMFSKICKGHAVIARARMQHHTLPRLWASAAVPFHCNYTGLRRNKELLASSCVGWDRAPIVLASAQWDRIAPLRKLDTQKISL